MGKLYVLTAAHPFYFSLIFCICRYSNTLLMTFNNRIALRKMTSVHQDNEGSRVRDSAPICQRMNFNGEVSTFRVAPDSFGKKSAGQQPESYEIDVSVMLNDVKLELIVVD